MVLVYLDNANTTRIDPEVLKAMEPYFTERYGTPGGEFGHSFDEEAREAVERSRQKIAKAIHADPDRVFFVSDETEADNLVILGFEGEKLGKLGSTQIERKSVISCVKSRDGILSPVDKDGFVKEIPKVDLFATHLVNFEIGVRQDVRAISDRVHDNGGFLYLDALHGFGNTEIDVEKQGIDALSISPHLFHGPKGIAAVYINESMPVRPVFHGDLREGGMRPGMINVPAIVGFGKAVELIKTVDWKRIRQMKDRLVKGLLEVDDSILNGTLDKHRSAPHISNISFLGAEGESILLHCDFRKIIVSTGSACYSQELKPSHVIMAIGGSYEQAHGSVRFSFGKYNKDEDVDYALENIPEIIGKIREISRGVT